MSTIRCLKVTVMGWHIINGIRGRVNCCPMALALAEQHPGAFEWFVFSNSAYCGPTEFFLSEPACQFITDFDRGERVPLGTFSLTERT